MLYAAAKSTRKSRSVSPLVVDIPLPLAPTAMLTQHLSSQSNDKSFKVATI